MLAGGTETMSRQPHIIRGARWGLRSAPGSSRTTSGSRSSTARTGCPWPLPRRTSRPRHDISPEGAGRLRATCSHLRRGRRPAAGHFAEEIVPVTLHVRGRAVRSRATSTSSPTRPWRSSTRCPPLFRRRHRHGRATPAASTTAPPRWSSRPGRRPRAGRRAARRASCLGCGRRGSGRHGHRPRAGGHARRWHRAGLTLRTWTWSRSTRLSRHSIWQWSGSSASTATGPMSMAAPSRSAIRWARPGHGWR